MSNFNDYFKNTGLKRMIDKFLDGADAYNPNFKITKLDYEILPDPGYPASYYIENGLTATSKVRITYELNNSGEPRYSEFEVPKEVDGTFIVEGSYRIATSKLGKDYECRIYKSGSGNQQVVIDYNRVYNIDKQILNIKNIDPNLGISDKPVEIRLDDLDLIVADPSKREMLRLTDRQIKKFQVKLNLDYTPEFIDKKLIEKCLELGDDRVYDFIVDKSIDSVPTSFMNFLFKDDNGMNFFTARKRIRSYFVKYDKLQEQLTAITTLCARFFRLGSQELQIPPGVNAVNLESFKSKIQVNMSVAYNTSMTDLIDIADTPINNNTNLQNSLTVSCHVTEDGVKFDVYDKGFNKITIDYLDYLNSRVVSSEYVDYEKNIVVPKNGMIEVKYRMRREMVDDNNYDLIDLHPDYRLSSTTRRIPFVNYTDSVRISMGTSMLKQSIPLTNGERPLVDTGNEDDLAENVLNDRYKFDNGEVIRITDKEVVILNTDTGNEISVPRRTAIQSVNNVSVYTEPKVKVGDKVKKGDIIIGAIEIDKDTVRSGLNTNVLFHAYHGLVNEDAVVVSESYAERMSHYSIIDIYIDVKTNSSITWIAPIGTKVKFKDEVVKTRKAVRLDEVNRLVNDKLLSPTDEGKTVDDFVVENNLIIPNNIDDAVVSDVVIQRNDNPKIRKGTKIDYTFSNTSIPVIDEYLKNYDRKVIYDNYPEYIAADTINEVNMENKSAKVVYTVKVRLIEKNKLGLGDKLTSRYGGKGVISKVVPDDKMPIVNGRKIEVVLNPYSTINRKIPSVIMETAMGNIAIKLHDNVQEMRKTVRGRKQIMPMINKYYENRYENLSVDEFLDLVDKNPIEDVFSFKVGCFSKYSPSIIKEWMNELGVSTQSKVLMPRSELTDLEALKEAMTEDEYNEFVKSIENEYVEVEQPLMSGMMTMEKLYHMPKYSNKVTTDMTDNRYGEPLMGRGRYRSEGQKIGEMELSALLARNAKAFIEASRKDTAKVDNQLFLNNLLALGLRVVDESGYNQGGSDLKEQMTLPHTGG